MVRDKEISEQMRIQSRARILAAARQLFAERGFFNCKVADIAQKAEMSQGNVYWYFPSKEDILKTVLSDGFNRIEEVITDSAAHPGNGLEKLDYLLKQYIALSQEQPEFTIIFLSILGHGGTQFMLDLGLDTVAIGTRYHQHLAAILEQARQEGLIADLDPNILSVFYFSFFNGLFITYPDDWNRVPVELIREAVMRMLGYLGETPVKDE
jgi:AcrR family transcriptional regulator